MTHTDAQTKMLSTIFSGSKPYQAKDYADKSVSFLLFDGTIKTFRPGDYASYYRNLSYREDARAYRDLESMISRLEKIKTAARKMYKAVPGQAQDIRTAADKSLRKHIQFSLEYMAAHQNMASAGIVGPSNFPADRERKKQDRAFKRYERLNEHVEKSAARFKKIAYPHGNPKEAIRSNHPEAISLLKDKIAVLKDRQQRMKSTNADVRKALRQDDPQAHMLKLGYSDDEARAYLKPSYSGRVKPYTFELSNNLQNIKRLESRLKSLELINDAPNRQDHFVLPSGDPLKIVRNTEIIRIQLFFKGKPDYDTRSLVKRYGFRWSPKAGAWQRHLNARGFDNTKSLLQRLGAEKAS